MADVKPAPSGTIYALPSSTNGVAMNPPGLSILGSVSSAVADACKAIPPDKRLALVAVTGGTGTNVALVTRIGDDLVATAWFGRSWKKDDKMDWGAQLMWTL
jgi:hypothetical protein